MEFRPTDAQIELQDTVARFCSDRYPSDRLSAREDAPLDRDTWAALADMGVLALRVPEADGGIGLGSVDAAILFEQLGAHLAPTALSWSVLVAPWVDGVATGEVVATGVDASAVRDGAAIIPDSPDADVIVVLDPAGPTLYRREALEVESMTSTDPLTRTGTVTGLTGGEKLGGPELADELRLVGTVLCAASLAGVAQRSLDVARDYALEREQFGTPIGSFQAVKHMLADMYLQAVTAQNSTYGAAAVIDDPGAADAARAASSAKLLAADAAVTNASTAVQVLGGMGFTWDMMPNYLLKRAWALEQDFGTRAEHEYELGSTLVSP